MLRTNVTDLIVKFALREDVGSRDVTSSAVIPSYSNAKAKFE